MKQTELLQKRNSELKKKVNDLNFQIAFDKEMNEKGYERAKNLITDLEHIKIEWQEALADLHDKQQEYRQLLADLRTMGKEVKNGGRKRPWHRQLLK